MHIINHTLVNMRLNAFYPHPEAQILPWCITDVFYSHLGYTMYHSIFYAKHALLNFVLWFVLYILNYTSRLNNYLLVKGELIRLKQICLNATTIKLKGCRMLILSSAQVSSCDVTSRRAHPLYLTTCLFLSLTRSCLYVRVSSSSGRTLPRLNSRSVLSISFCKKFAHTTSHFIEILNSRCSCSFVFVLIPSDEMELRGK